MQINISWSYFYNKFFQVKNILLITFIAPGIKGCPFTKDLLELSTCIKDRLELLKPMFETGIESMNLPTLDPFFLENININQTGFLVSLEGLIKNVKVEGFKNFVLKEIFFNPETLDFSSSLCTPQMKISADYDVKGRLLIFTLPGSGSFQVNAG